MIGWILVGLLQSSPVVVQLHGKFDNKADCVAAKEYGIKASPELAERLDCWKIEAEKLKESGEKPANVPPAKELPNYKLNGTGLV